MSSGNQLLRAFSSSWRISSRRSRHGRLWDVDVSATYHSGWPKTAVGSVTIDSAGDVTGERNTGRYESFRTLDVRATRRFPRAPGDFSAYVEVINLFAETNPCCTELEFDGDPPRLETNREYWPGTFPSIGFYWRY